MRFIILPKTTKIKVCFIEISEKLESWKKGSRKHLIVSGLRKVGKTTTILDFCNKNYENVAYIDFESDKSYSEIFEGDFDIDRITSLFSTKIDNILFVPNKTIIFFDEIEECANARASLKYFYLDKRYDVICSSSLLLTKGYLPYYYSKTNRLEIDFVIENNENPVVLEVKATNSKSKSLNTIATNQTNYGSNDFMFLKFYEKNISVNKDLGVINLPYYTIDFFDFNNFTKEKRDKIV